MTALEGEAQIQRQKTNNVRDAKEQEEAKQRTAKGKQEAKEAKEAKQRAALENKNAKEKQKQQQAATRVAQKQTTGVHPNAYKKGL